MMVDPNLEEPTVAGTFKFKGRIAGPIFLGIILSMFGALGVLMTVREGITRGAIFFLVTMLPFLLLGSIFLKGRSDLRIDSVGVSRSLLGKSIQMLPWTEIAKVRLFSMRIAGRSVQAFNIMPKSKQGPKGNRQVKMAFTDNCEDMHGITDALNFYIRKYNIPVEKIIRGTLTVATKI